MKHLVDTDIYIEFLQTGQHGKLLQELYRTETPRIYLSSVVIAELLMGAITPAGKRHVETLVRPFEQTGRIVTPSHVIWRETGLLLRQILSRRRDLKDKLPHLVNDCLIALSAREIGARVYTSNAKDFELLQSFRSFSLQVT